jgi:hypothetical protein
VIVPVREAPLLAARVSATTPLPLPGAPLVTVAQLTFEVAVQLHPLPAVTDIDVLPAFAPNARLAGEIE